MKKTLSLVLMLCMLVSVVAPTLVFAADKTVTVQVGDIPVGYDDAKLALLADGNTASDATSFSSDGLVGFENQGFTHTDGVDAAVEATFEIILDLGEVQTIGSISLDAYNEPNSMIVLPTVNYYVSADGVDYYHINAGNAVTPAADAAENTVHTLKADFTTRIAVEAQYVKAVVSFKNGWVFLSELSVGAGNADVVSEAPGRDLPYSEHTVPNPGIGVYDSTDGELDLSVNDGETGMLLRNAQLIKATYDAEVGAYVISYSKVNPWPDGHSGTETLAEGEILVAISTLGTVTGDAFSGAKWIARGLKAGDLIVLDNGMMRFLPAGADVSANTPVLPDVSEDVSAEESDDPAVDTPVEELPEGALVLDYAGYKHAGFNSIVAGDGMTVSELTALGNDGVAKDMNYAYIVVVDANNVVTSTWYELSVSKADVVCPEGGYIISFNGNKAGKEYETLTAVEVGATVTLYNVDVDAFRGAEGNYELTNAGFTFENPVKEPDVPTTDSGNLAAGKDVANAENVDASITTFWVDTDLTDGVAQSDWALDWAPGEWHGYWWNADAENAYEKANADDGIAIPTIDLGTECTIESARINMFLGNDMGICPAKSVALQISNDGETFETVATVELTTPEGADTTVGWVELTPETAVNARYVRLEMLLAGYWLFVDEIEIYGFENGSESTPVEPDVPVDPETKTYENTLVEGEDGNYSCEVPYGYTWEVDSNNGVIAGEDVTICTTQDAYKACNPNWAITIYAELQEDGTYVALQDAIVTPGSAANAGITIGENQIAIVAHSAYSNPNGSNWMGKVVAMAVKAGDVFTVTEKDGEITSVYAVIPGEEIVIPDPDVPVDPDIPDVPEPEENIETLISAVLGEDNTVYVTLSFANIVSAINGVSAELHFDAEALTLISAVDEETGEVDCVGKLPEKWENLTAVSSDGSCITVNLCVTEDPDQILADDNFELVFAFAANAGYESTEITVTNVEFLDTDINYIYGNDASLVIDLPEQDISEPTNLVAGKEWTGDTEIGTSYVGDLTDGVIDPDGKYDQSIWYGADNRKDADGKFTMIFDLGGKYSITEVLAHVWPAGISGIVTPASVDFYVSADGETYELIGSVASFDSNAPQWVGVKVDGVEANYVRVDMVGAKEGDTGVFWFASEVEVYGVAATEEPVEPTGSESLIPGEGAYWTKTDNGGASVDVVYNEDGSVIFSGSVSGTWPCVESWYVATPIVADTLDDYLSIDFTVAGGSTNINFFFDDGNGGSVGFSISNSALLAACPNASIDSGSGDIYDGTYQCTISIADLIAATMNLQGRAFPEAAIIDGTVRFIGINVYSVNGAVITVNDMSVVHVSDVEPEPPVVSDGIVIDGEVTENAYDNADWFNQGVWQTLNDYVMDLDVSYTTLTDDENVYLTIVVNGKGVELASALNPDAWDQSGATDFRLWFKGDGMETRTFYDLLWNGEAFAPFREKKATDEMAYAATYGDDYIVMEVKIAKESLAITDSYEMMVTFSSPYIGEGENVGYNAYHMTSFVRGEDGALPEKWSQNTSMYETYYCAENSIEVVLYGDCNGDGVINGKDAVVLHQYLANYNYVDGTCSISIGAGADVTGDGVIDGRDSIRLLKYLANLDHNTGDSPVELG